MNENVGSAVPINRQAATQRTSSGTTSGMKGGTQADAAELMDQARDTVTETAGNLGDALQNELNKRFHEGGHRLQGTVKNLHEVGDTLNQKGNPSAGRMVHRAADQAERVTHYIDSSSPEELVSDMSDYARQHMWTALAIGAVVGVAASRFLKSAFSSGRTMSSGTAQQRSRMAA